MEIKTFFGSKIAQTCFPNKPTFRALQEWPPMLIESACFRSDLDPKNNSFPLEGNHEKVPSEYQQNYLRG